VPRVGKMRYNKRLCTGGKRPNVTREVGDLLCPVKKKRGTIKERNGGEGGCLEGS